MNGRREDKDGTERWWKSSVMASDRVIDVVGRDAAGLAVNLGAAGRLFLNQLEAEGILPLHVENVVDHAIDERRLAGTGCSHHQNPFDAESFLSAGRLHLSSHRFFRKRNDRPSNAIQLLL